MQQSRRTVTAFNIQAFLMRHSLLAWICCVCSVSLLCKVEEEEEEEGAAFGICLSATLTDQSFFVSLPDLEIEEIVKS